MSTASHVVVFITVACLTITLVQIRPGGLAAFPVEVPGVGGAVEEALAIIVEVPRGARPVHEDMQALASHVRATVRRPSPRRCVREGKAHARLST